MSPKVKKYIWYQVDEGEISSVEQPLAGEFSQLRRIIKEHEGLQAAASTLTLRAKKTTEQEYTTLNTSFFRDNCGNNFASLIRKFDITQNNPIKVTLPATASKNNRIQELVEARLAALQITQGTSSPAGAPAQAPSNEIHVRYNDQTITFRQQWLDDGEISNVDDLIDVIKRRLRNTVENVYEKVVTLRRGENEELSSETLISGLYNTNENALEIVIDDLTGKMSKSVIREDEPNFEYASLAFNHEFKDDSNYVQNFHNYITLCHNSSKNRDSYMPYISIVQSSGYGKSRLIKEHAKQVYTLYLNLGIDRNCFPRPSACAKKFIKCFEVAKDPVKWFNNFLVMAISLINTGYNPSEFWRHHLEDNGDSIWKRAIEAADRCELTRNQELYNISVDAGYLKEKFNISADIKVLLCIDEGRTLLQHVNENQPISLFRLWRRALRTNTWRAEGLFSVILDTTSRISNFAPTLGKDPTIKEITDRKIFMPFVYVSTFNFLIESSGSYYNKLFSGGRPCWKALKDAYLKGSGAEASEIKAWEDVKVLVKAKLQGGSNDLIDGDEETKNLTSLAILASLCSVDISPSVHFSSNLIASHLGTCLAISQDKTKVLACYPPEPIITEAAYELLNNDVLNCIAQTLGQGIVESGKRGELAGELILVLTRQRLQKRNKTARNTSFFAGEIKLTNFLDELLNNNITLDKNNAEHNYLKNASISFTRFVTISTIPIYNDLMKGYQTGVAFNLKRNQQGADFLIPLCIENNNNNEYSSWIIQIKNHNLKNTDSNFKVDSTSKLTPEYAFKKSDLEKSKVPYLAMYWQLGAHEKKIEEADWGVETRSTDQNPRPTTHYSIIGLKSFNIARGKDLESLRAILKAYIDPYNAIWSNNDKFLGEQIPYIEKFLPWNPSKPNEKLLLDKYDDKDAE